MNHLTTRSGARRTMNQLTAVPGDSRTMNQLTAVPGDSRTMNQLTAVLGDSRTMNQLTAVLGARRTMNQLTAVPGDSRTMNQLTPVLGDSRTMNQLLAVSDDSRTIEHPLTVSGARSAMNNITIFMLAAFLLLAFPMRGQACPEPLTCLPREECVSQLRGHTQAQTDILFVCSSAHGENTICCPAVESLEEWDASSTVAVTLRSSVHPSMHLMPSGDACDVISLDRIRNGIVAKQGQFPWMTLLGYRLSDGKLYFLCGGTLINRRYVLTAAHCLQPEGATLELVRLGELDTSTEQDCEEPYPGEKICADPVLDINIEKVVKHKRFNIPFLKNDIALLRLVSEVPSYTDFIRPICLPFGLNLTEDGDKKYQVAGWGKTEHYNTVGSAKLMYTFLQNVPLEDCDSIQALEVRPLDHTQLCAGGNLGKDACRGDSGGPLMGKRESPTTSQEQTYQLGIVSFGSIPCGSNKAPSVFTRVSEYLDWILDNIYP